MIRDGRNWRVFVRLSISSSPDLGGCPSVPGTSSYVGRVPPLCHRVSGAEWCASPNRNHVALCVKCRAAHLFHAHYYGYDDSAVALVVGDEVC